MKRSSKRSIRSTCTLISVIALCICTSCSQNLTVPPIQAPIGRGPVDERLLARQAPTTSWLLRSPTMLDRIR